MPRGWTFISEIRDGTQLPPPLLVQSPSNLMLDHPLVQYVTDFYRLFSILVVL